VVAEDQGSRDADAADKHRDDRERREQLAHGLHLLPLSAASSACEVAPHARC
jgi:hypothetical protein